MEIWQDTKTCFPRPKFLWSLVISLKETCDMTSPLGSFVFFVNIKMWLFLHLRVLFLGLINLCSFVNVNMLPLPKRFPTLVSAWPLNHFAGFYVLSAFLFFVFKYTKSLQFFFSKKRKEKKRKEKSLQFSIFQLQTYIIKYVSSFKPGTSQDFDLEVQNLNQIFFFIIE